MLRAAIVFAMLSFVGPPAVDAQALSSLHIKVVLADAERKATPVPHHVLLVSENPASASPRRIVTAPDGTATVRLRPGNYTVESDRPVTLHGKSYQWTQIIDVAAGRETVLELTDANAEIASLATAAGVAAPFESDPAFLLPRWQDSVFAVWSPTARASGFLIDARGLVATNQQVVGAATSVEVQLTASVKVRSRVLVADPVRDVAILWMDPRAAASILPVPLECADAAKASVADGQEVFTIGAPVREQKGMTSGTVGGVGPHRLDSDLMLARGSAGGPVFTAGGTVAGITSVPDEKEEGRRGGAPIARVDAVCDALASAGKNLKDGSPPDGTRLPVEPSQPFPVGVLEAEVRRRAGSLNPYQMSSADFDIAFITPVLTYGAQHLSDQAARRERERGTRTTEAEQAFVRPLMNFSNWSEYVADFPPVLLVRVTPRLVEGFWTTVARGAARTQGVSLPPIKRRRPGFSRMAAFCGDAEVPPIHPFTLEQRISESDAISEGLYVFDPGALGPHCGAVKLVLYSEKEPSKGDTRVVDPRVLQQVWQDFAPYRALKSEGGR